MPIVLGRQAARKQAVLRFSSLQKLIDRLKETFVAATTVAVATNVTCAGAGGGWIGCADQGPLERETKRLKKVVAEG